MTFGFGEKRFRKNLPLCDLRSRECPLLLAYQSELLTFTALVGIAIAIAVPILRSFDVTRPFTAIIVLGSLIVTFIGICLLNYRDGFPLDGDYGDDYDGDD